MQVNRIDFEYEKKLIQEQERYRIEQLKKEIIKATTYEKGKVTKEVFKLPMPSGKNILDNKNLNLKTYGAFMLESNWGGKFLNPHSRYIYKDKWDIVINEVATDLKISQSTIKRHINKLKKCDIKAIELIKTSNNDLVYKLNYGSLNVNTGQLEKFVSITNIALRKLVNAYSEYSLRIYLYLLYRCKNGECIIKQSEICKAIGISEKSRKIVTDCVNALECGRFIDVNVEYIITMVEKNGELQEKSVPQYTYSLSDEYLTLSLGNRKKI